MRNPARTTLIGMLTPSSNTVLEPYTSAMAWPLFPEVSVHYSRIPVTKISLDASSNNQFKLEPILQAARLLADARVDIIAWNGTSASWLGFDADERLCAAIAEETGIPATSTTISFNRLYQHLQVRKIGLVTPYTKDVQQKIMDNYAAAGIETVAERHDDRIDSFTIAAISEPDVAAMCRDVAKANPDAISIVCTNMRGPMIAQELEEELGIPVLDSVAVTLWGCLMETGVNMQPLADFGRIFRTDLAFSGMRAGFAGARDRLS